jgi:transmembrane sensor
MIVGGGALAASVAAAGFFVTNRSRTIESGVGEVRHLALAGGTTLVLDTDTRVDVALSSDERRLELVRGKIFLDVARAAAPIMVRTADLLLATTEGAFGLQNLQNAAIMALVTKGSLVASQSQGMFAAKQTVSIDQDHGLTLSPNARLEAGDVRPVTSPQRDQFLAWRDGMLSFGGETLADAVRAFDRYGTTRIMVADPALARQRITGLFKANDPKGFARAVAASFGAVVSIRGDVVQLAGKKSTPA